MGVDKEIEAILGYLFAPLRGRVDVTAEATRKYRAEVRLKGRTVSLEVRWAGEGWPRDINWAVQGPRKWPSKTIVVGKRFSTGSLRRLEDRDANWADQTGAARLLVPPWIYISTARGEVEPTRGEEFRWSPSALHLAEFILERQPRLLRADLLAADTGWSRPQVSKILQLFDAQGWTSRRGGGRGPSARRELENPTSLLNSWAQHWLGVEEPTIQAHRVFKDVTHFAMASLPKALGRGDSWGVTGWVAAYLLAPYMSTLPSLQVRLTKPRLARVGPLLKGLQLRRVDSGGNVSFIGSEWLVAGPSSSLRLVSRPRVYADLLALGGRAEDAASHLREAVLGF
jgi:hypothetical protein